MHGLIHWTELNTANPEAAKAFYGKVAGWTFEAMETEVGQEYWICSVDDEPVAGIYGVSGEKAAGFGDHWLSYITVENVDAASEAAKEAGATMVRDAWDVPGTGRFAIVKDPGGALIAWMTPVASEDDEEDEDDDKDEDDEDAESEDKDDGEDGDKVTESNSSESASSEDDGDAVRKAKEFGIHN